MNNTLKLIGALIGFALVNSGNAATRDDSATEALGWKVALKGYTLNMFPVFEQLEIMKDLNVKYYELNIGQNMKTGSDVKIDPNMSPQALNEFKSKLTECGIKVVSCGILIKKPETDEAALRKLFSFLKDLGCENIGIESDPNELLVKVSTEYGIKVAIHNHPNTYPPEKVLEATKGLPPTFGACADVGHWKRRGLNSPEQIKVLGARIIQLHIKDVNEAKVDVQIGTGVVDIKGVLRELKAINFKGVLTIEYDAKPKDPVVARKDFVPQLGRDVAFIDSTAKELIGNKP